MPADSFRDDNAWQVFVSYRRPKRDETGAFVGSKASLEVARWLKSELETREIEANTGDLVKLRVFVDEDEPSLSNWRDKLIPTLQYSKAVIVLLDRAAVKRKQGVDYLYEELELVASNPKRTPILLQLDTVSRDALVAQPKFNKWEQVHALPCYWDAWRKETSDERAANLNRLITQVRESIRNLGSVRLAQQIEEMRQALERETESRKAETKARKKATRRAFVATLLLVAAVAAAAWAVTELMEANTALEGERAALFEAQKQRIIATANEKKAIIQQKLAKTKQKEAERRTYQAQVIAANELVQKDRIAEARAILFATQHDLRDWEWGFLMQLCGPNGQHLSDFEIRTANDHTDTLNEFLIQARSSDAPQKDRIPFPETNMGEHHHLDVPIRRSSPTTELLMFWTETAGEIQSARFSKDHSLAFIKADSFQTSFGEKIGTGGENDVVAIGLPERFNLSKLGPNKDWLVQPDIRFFRANQVSIFGPQNEPDERIELIFDKQGGQFQLVPPKPLGPHGRRNKSDLAWLHKPDDFENKAHLAWLDDDVEIPADSKKLWRSKFKNTMDGLEFGDHVQIDGRDCVTVVRSNGTAEIWSVPDATLKASFGAPEGKPCYDVERQFGALESGSCRLRAAATVSMTAERIFFTAVATDLSPEGTLDSKGDGGVIYDLKTLKRICCLFDEEGEPIGLGSEEPGWGGIKAQLDPNGEFVAVRETGSREENLDIWDASTGRPIFRSISGEGVQEGTWDDYGPLPEWGNPGWKDTGDRRRKRWGDIPGIGDIIGINWSSDGHLVVVVDARGEVFVKSHLLGPSAHKITGANLSNVLEDRVYESRGHWSPVKFPVRWVSQKRLLIANYLIDTEMWTVVLEFPKNAEVRGDNAVVATWTGRGELELCDMSFWRSYQVKSFDGLNLRNKLLLWQILNRDKEHQ